MEVCFEGRALQYLGADKHTVPEKEESGMLPGNRKEEGAIVGSREGSRIWVLRKWSRVTEMLWGHPVRRVKKLGKSYQEIISPEPQIPGE